MHMQSHVNIRVTKSETFMIDEGKLAVGGPTHPGLCGSFLVGTFQVPYQGNLLSQSKKRTISPSQLAPKHPTVLPSGVHQAVSLS